MKTVIFLSLLTLSLMEVSILPVHLLPIFDGNKAINYEFNYMCAIKRINLADPSKNQRCGCAMLSDNYVITAAHCFDDRDLNTTVLYGNQNIDRHSYENTVTIDAVTVHPEYNARGTNPLTDDLAIVKTKLKFLFQNKRTSTIWLPSPEDCTADNYYISGWGKLHNIISTSDLHYGKVEPKREEKCKKNISTYDHKKNICTGRGTGHGACSGDNGGPLAERKDKKEKFVLCGIIGSAKSDCSKNYTFYMRVSYYKKWICETINNTAVGCTDSAA